MTSNTFKKTLKTKSKEKNNSFFNLFKKNIWLKRKWWLLVWIIVTSLTAFMVFVYSKYSIEKIEKHVPITQALHPRNIVAGKFWALHFTAQTNFLVFIYFTLRTFNLIDPRKNKKAKFFQYFVVINISVTMITYWVILAWISSIWTTADTTTKVLNIINTFGAHLINPLIMIILFYLENRKTKINENNVNIKKIETLWVVLYPLLWLIGAIIFYYSTLETHYFKEIKSKDGLTHWLEQINHESWSGDPKLRWTYGIGIYFFLNFGLTKWWICTIIIISLVLFFICLCFLYWNLVDRQFFFGKTSKKKFNKNVKESKNKKTNIVKKPAANVTTSANKKAKVAKKSVTTNKSVLAKKNVSFKKPAAKKTK